MGRICINRGNLVYPDMLKIMQTTTSFYGVLIKIYLLFDHPVHAFKSNIFLPVREAKRNRDSSASDGGHWNDVEFVAARGDGGARVAAAEGRGGGGVGGGRGRGRRRR